MSSRMKKTLLLMSFVINVIYKIQNLNQRRVTRQSKRYNSSGCSNTRVPCSSNTARKLCQLWHFIFHFFPHLCVCSSLYIALKMWKYMHICYYHSIFRLTSQGKSFEHGLAWAYPMSMSTDYEHGIRGKERYAYNGWNFHQNKFTSITNTFTVEIQMKWSSLQ